MAHDSLERILVDPILLLLVFFAIMMIPMFMMSRRQRKAQQSQQEMLRTLGVGDEVRTHSGFYGLIVEEFDDTVILESENGAQLKWARAAISMKIDPADGTPVVEEDTAENVERPLDGDPVEPARSADLDAEGSSAVHDADPREGTGLPSDTDRR